MQEKGAHVPARELDIEALVVGAGPAGLMAAEVLSAAGRTVVVAEAMPSPGRKLLMAGKSGLNLTKAEPLQAFRAAYSEGREPLAPILGDFGPEAVRAWASGLGIETFAGSSGRVFPVGMKASPLLRAWLGRLERQGVALRRRWRWTGWSGARAVFETPDGPVAVLARATILALGGASWRRLGSDGAWATPLAAAGIGLAPFRPSNVGFAVDWSPVMARHFGAAVKPVRLMAGGEVSRGEVVLTARGIEGGGIYALSHLLREDVPLVMDLLPDIEAGDVVRRLSLPRGGASLSNHLRRRLGMPPVKLALLREFYPQAPAAGPEQLSVGLKALPIRLAGPRPLDEAISTAGGVRFAEVDDGLMLKALPGVFVAGEMLDWDAPTGGYLLTACLATGHAAGRAAVVWTGA